MAFAAGLVVDAPGDRLFWVNDDLDSISFAKLDGSGGADLTIAHATVREPYGLALDPLAGRLYWTNRGDNTISTAKLDGSDDRNLPIPSADVHSPTGIAVDLVHGRVYWVNNGAVDHTIWSATLDGGDPRQVPIPGGVIVDSHGLAVDPLGGRLYWDEYTAIDAADLDGAHAGPLTTTGADVLAPQGVAFDPDTSTLYWGNAAPQALVSFHRLTGASGNLVPGSAVTAGGFPVLLRAPVSKSAPAVSGGAMVGAPLSCATGAWSLGAPGSFVYTGVRDYAYQWSRDGADLAGATGAFLTADAVGDYRCRVTASNRAGATTAESPPWHVEPLVEPRGAGAFGAATRVTVALASARASRSGAFGVRVANANAFAVTGSLAVATAKPVSGAHGKRVSLHAKAIQLARSSRKTVAFALPGSLRRLLARGGKLALVITAKVSDPAGHRRTVTAKATLRGPR